MGSLLNDVVINKLSGGLGRRAPDRDMVSGLLFGISADNDTATDFIAKGPQRLASLEDAIAVGLDNTIDVEGCSVYYQISQFFRMNPSGDLWVMGAGAKSYEDLLSKDGDDGTSKAEELLVAADGEIRQLAVTFDNPAITFSGTDASTKNTTIAAISAAAIITKNAFEIDYRPLEILIEGKGFGSMTAASATDLRGLNAPNVSVVVAMDVEKAQQDNYSNTAAVGTLLGVVSKAKVSENIAWIEKFNLTGAGFGSVGFVGGASFITQGDQGTLNDKGYIFARKHIGISGIYFNDSHTCTELTDDFAYIEANRTINKAARIARTALLPKLNSPILVDPDTGKLAPSVVKGFETLCRSALERMISNEEASEIDVFVDPNQDILADSQLNVKIAIVPLGTARKIIVDLGFKNPFQINAAANA